MSLIIIAVYDTETNGRTKYTKECLSSLRDTVDLEKHSIIVVNNNSCEETREYLAGLRDIYTVINLSENIGTARAVNIGLNKRKPGQMCVKMDNDVVVHQSGWIEEMEAVFAERHDIGIVGLKRDDVWQRPDHENPAYRTKMEGKLEICEDIMGTCTGYNPSLMDKIGLLSQPTCYGFDDVLYSVRSIAAGFTNCFLPSIKITHLDDYKNPYSDWKKRHAGDYIDEVSVMCEMIKSGKLSYYYGGN